MTIRNYSTTPGSNNSAPPNGWPEGQAASTVNDCARQMMAEIRESFEELPYFDYGHTPTRVDNDTFTLSGDQTATYAVGYRVKLVGATTGYGRITVSSHAAGTTTIDVVMDSGNVPTSLTRVAVNNSAALGVGSATPGAVTLSASVGTRTLASREDHVHALDQTIAPTMSALWKFTRATAGGSGLAIGMESGLPGLYFKDTGAAADNKIWSDFVFSGVRGFQIYNDAENTNNPWLTVSRSGATVGAVSFPADGSGGVGGKFQVGTNNSSSGLANVLVQIRSTTAQTTAVFRNSNSANYPLAVHNEATSGDNAFALFATEGLATTRGSITYNRAGGLTAYNTTSRRELKTNIRASGSAIAKLMQIPIRAFDWIDPVGAKLDWWVVADELEPICPWAADPDGVNPAALVFLTIKSVQEQQAQIAQLQATVQQLVSRVAALEGVRAAAPK